MSLQEGLRLNGLTRGDVTDMLNIVSRRRILSGAAAWHEHGKSHPQDEEEATEAINETRVNRQVVTRTLPSAPPLPTTGTPYNLLGELFAPIAAPYVNPLESTTQQYEYHWRKTDARTEAGRNAKLQGITQHSARADRDALTRNMHSARHRIARIALPPQSQEDCTCGNPGYDREGSSLCAPCRLASYHYGESGRETHARRHMCAHCQICGIDEPQFAIAGLTWACQLCASHIAGTMTPRPQFAYDLPKTCADCSSTTAPRFGLDGRPLCTTCQDPSYPFYLTARAGIMVQDYLNVCHDIQRAIPVNARTTPALLALANMLPQDPRNGNLFQPTRWSDLVGPIHALAKLIALDIDLPQNSHTCVTAQHRLLYNYSTARMVSTAREYGALSNHTMLCTRPDPPRRGSKRKVRATGHTTTRNESLAANSRRMHDAEQEAQPQGRRNPLRRRVMSDSDGETSALPQTNRRDRGSGTPAAPPAGAQAPATSVVTPSPPPPVTQPTGNGAIGPRGRSSLRLPPPPPPAHPPPPPPPPLRPLPPPLRTTAPPPAQPKPPPPTNGRATAALAVAKPARPVTPPEPPGQCLPPPPPPQLPPPPPPKTAIPSPPRPVHRTTTPPDACQGPDPAHTARHQAAGTGRFSRRHQPKTTESRHHAAATADDAGTAGRGRPKTHRTSRQPAAAEPRHRRALRRAPCRARRRAHCDARDPNAAERPPRHRRPGRQAATPRRPRHRGTQPTTPPLPRRQGRTTKKAQDLQGDDESGTSLYRDPGAALLRVAGRSSEPPCPSPGATRVFLTKATRPPHP